MRKREKRGRGRSHLIQTMASITACRKLLCLLLLIQAVLSDEGTVPVINASVQSLHISRLTTLSICLTRCRCFSLAKSNYREGQLFDKRTKTRKHTHPFSNTNKITLTLPSLTLMLSLTPTIYFSAVWHMVYQHLFYFVNTCITIFFVELIKTKANIIIQLIYII